MGQGLSLGTNEVSDDVKNNYVELFSKDEIIEMFQSRCYSLLRPLELNSMATKLNTTSLREKVILTNGDVSYLFGLSNDALQSTHSSNHSLSRALDLLFQSFRVVGQFPFLQDYFRNETLGLTIPDLVVCSAFHSGRYTRLISHFDYLELLFIAFALPGIAKSEAGNEKGVTSDPKSKNLYLSEEIVSKDDDPYTIKVSRSLENEDNMDKRAKFVKWDTFDRIRSFDNIDVELLNLNAADLHCLITLFLIITSISGRDFAIQNVSILDFSNKWEEFEVLSLSLIRYININITSKTIHTFEINFEEFKEGVTKGFPNLFNRGLMMLFKQGIFSPMPKSLHSGQLQGMPDLPKGSKRVTLKETKLVNEATISYISLVLNTLKSNVVVSDQNMIQLYIDSYSGFSIRSLELKIFKWQAPTIFFVSGKRLKNKTIHSNKRYQKFDSEYPRFFLSLENSRKDWQHDNERITYAVLVTQPWRNSNKRNFGDEGTVIIQLLPRLDFYKSVHNPVLKGELIYFNNLGCGVGFGNNQPINKNTVRKYVPGDVSLTIEANLEFAIFRHLSTLTSRTTSYFQKTQQHQIIHEDYEDRFMITDLEVWGVGSTKELDEQKKQWEWEEKQAEARRGINLKNLGEERAFLEMVGLVGNHNSSGGSI
ncbi:uncharacterized protein PRCAT00000703001 [Priceomyces carsonii]|uniref:uncharacterized protein n=1 Tax=Priceomyces carsonii TaxID=28549 RepID=UPI002EDACE17|nr:unnamed protein product [Priceomyces carsonii]